MFTFLIGRTDCADKVKFIQKMKIKIFDFKYISIK